MYELIEQTNAIIDKEMPLITNLSNISAVINQLSDINWCGFYLVKGEYLYLSPFQGEVACTKIKIGKGVCDLSLLKKETIIVDNVLKFEGHIACSDKSRSEIVVLIIQNQNVVALIDIDSPLYSRFKEKEKEIIEEIAKIISKKLDFNYRF